MRLKALITTGMICTAALGIAAPAQAKSDNGNGKTQRCEAAQNGQHKGFTCDAVIDDVAGVCSRGYTVGYSTQIDVTADENSNGIVCRSTSAA